VKRSKEGEGGWSHEGFELYGKKDQQQNQEKKVEDEMG